MGGGGGGDQHCSDYIYTVLPPPISLYISISVCVCASVVVGRSVDANTYEVMAYKLWRAHLLAARNGRVVLYRFLT